MVQDRQYINKIKMNKETIEKAAEEFAKNHSIYPTTQDDTEYGFKHGAMWMKEQMEILKDFDTWKEWINKPENK